MKPSNAPQLDHKSPISWGNSGYFGFPVGGRLAAWQADSWPQLPKLALFRHINAVFWPEINSFALSQKNCYSHDRTPKRQPVCVDCVAGWSPGVRPGPFGPKIGPKIRFFYAELLTRLLLFTPRINLRILPQALSYFAELQLRHPIKVVQRSNRRWYYYYALFLFHLLALQCWHKW